VFDYKKGYKDLYLPKTEPGIVEVPPANFITVLGRGDPNEEGGAYRKALEVLYGISYTIKMSKKGGYVPPGYFDYVVPPLEGLWWTDNEDERNTKSKYNWISMIRAPEYVTEEVFEWARNETAKKKKTQADACLLSLTEGLCVQCLHIGSFDDESKTFEKIDAYIAANHLKKNNTEVWKHHEIYLSDPRKADPSKMKTVLRVSVEK
jgi:hypothetical protein